MQERRRSLIAIARFQYHWILQVILGSFILINLSLIAAFLYGGNLASPPDRLTLALTVAVIEILGLILLYKYALRHSSRIAGPVYRLARLAEDLENGDLTAVARIREADFFHEEVNALNSAVETIRGHLAEAQRHAEGDGGNEAERLAAVRQQLSWFKT